jgi:hypothetical protein
VPAPERRCRCSLHDTGPVFLFRSAGDHRFVTRGPDGCQGDGFAEHMGRFWAITPFSPGPACGSCPRGSGRWSRRRNARSKDVYPGCPLQPRMPGKTVSGLGVHEVGFPGQRASGSDRPHIPELENTNPSHPVRSARVFRKAISTSPCSLSPSWRNTRTGLAFFAMTGIQRTSIPGAVNEQKTGSRFSSPFFRASVPGQPVVPDQMVDGSTEPPRHPPIPRIGTSNSGIRSTGETR